ncbi:MAG: hypothetical protein ABR521_09260 [Gaiellaceae bacterium]
MKTTLLADSEVEAGGAATVDLDVKEYETAIVLAAMAGPGAASDLVVEVRAYEPDGVTVFDQPLPTTASVPSALIDDVARTTQGYDLRGLERVQVRAINAGSAAHAVTVHAFCGAY